MRMIGMSMIVAIVAPMAPAPAAADPVRGLTRVGQCAKATVKSIGQRLVDGTNNMPVKGSGSAVELSNGVYGVSYEQIPAVDRSRRGDAVRVCLVSLPRNCPKGDDRGREYKVTNLRTRQSWTLPDAEHMCGGA